jgi:hypothetical protein
MVAAQLCRFRVVCASHNINPYWPGPARQQDMSDYPNSMQIGQLLHQAGLPWTPSVPRLLVLFIYLGVSY